MEIIVGKNSGFCYGVNNAYMGALNNLNSYCLGELVHNEDVINDLENKGIKFIDNLDNLNNTTVLIRAHGVPKEIYKEADLKHIKLKDYTCPNVLKIHDLVTTYKDYYIILTGSKIHPENIGTVSFANNYYILEDIIDIPNMLIDLKKKNINKVLLISQTTFNYNKFKEIETILLNKIPNLQVKNTICKATELRQIETTELSKKVDLMIIIGGKNSSNTHKLFDLAKASTETIIITNYKELDNYNLNYEKIGIMAGASTPKESIDQVVEYLNNKRKTK